MDTIALYWLRSQSCRHYILYSQVNLINTKSVKADKSDQPSEARKTSRTEMRSELVFGLLPASNYITCHRRFCIHLEPLSKLISVL